MENLAGEDPREQGQQVSAESTHTEPTPAAGQLAEFAAANHQTRQKSDTPEPFAQEMETPVRRTEAPQSTGILNPRFLLPSSAVSELEVQTTTSVDENHSALLAACASNQELSTSDVNLNDHDLIQPIKSALRTTADLREQLREEIRKEMELLYDSRLAKRTFELETVWRGKREERTKVVENYWKQKLAEAMANGRDEKRELHEEIDKLRKRLDKGPGLIKAAEERGKRQGELDGFNKLSLHPELKLSQDRLNFDFLMKEKDKKLTELETSRDNCFKDARIYSEEMNAKLREKDQEIQRLSAQAQTPPGLNQLKGLHQEKLELLKSQLAESESLLEAARRENALLHDKQVGNELEDHPANFKGRNSGDDTELVKARLEEERDINEAENSRQESRLNAALNGLREADQEGKQMLMNELESKDVQLYNAHKKARELEQQLLAFLSLHFSQSSTSPLDTLPPSPALPISTQPSPSTFPTSPTAVSSSRLGRSRFAALRNLLIVILIFFLAFLVPHLQSLTNSGSEYELVDPISRDGRIQWEAWKLANWERNEGVPTYEESWRRTQEVGQMGDWGP